MTKIKHGLHHRVRSQPKEEENGTSGQAFYSARAYWFHINAPTPARDNSLIGMLKNMRLYWLSAILHPACRFVFTSLCQKKQRAYGSLKWPAAMAIKRSFIAILFFCTVVWLISGEGSGPHAWKRTQKRTKTIRANWSLYFVLICRYSHRSRDSRAWAPRAPR